MKAILMVGIIALLTSTTQAVNVDSLHKAHHMSTHKMKHRGGSKDDLVLEGESQEAEETFELVENKKVFKDDYGKDIVDPDEIKDWEN